MTRQRQILGTELRQHAVELEETVCDRIRALESASSPDPGGYIGPRARQAIHAAVSYGVAVIELGEHRVATLPLEVTCHARCSARNSIPLETLVSRYLAGYSVFAAYVIKANEELRQEGQLFRIHNSLAVCFEQLTTAITAEYKKETARQGMTSADRRLRRVNDLLSGTIMDAPDLSYDFGRNHIALIALESQAESLTRRLADRLGGQLLLVGDSEAAWIWIGTQRPLKSRTVKEIVASEEAPPGRVAIGEPARDIAGWRKTHQQARNAYRFHPQAGPWVVRYIEVALTASLAGDDLLRSSLQETYLAPLEEERDGGSAFRDTLRAYFAAAGNASAAASALGVNRATVSARITTIEERLGCSLTSIAPELVTVLRFDALTKS